MLKRIKFKRPMIVLFLGVVLITLLMYALKYYYRADQLYLPIFTPKIKMNTFVLDKVEDLKALGYSGQKKLSVDSKGNVYIVYRDKADGEYAVVLKKLAPKTDGSYSESRASGKVHDSFETPQRVPSVVIDDNDNIHIVWYGSTSTEYENDRQIKYTRSGDGGLGFSKWGFVSYVEGYNKKEDYWQEHPDIAQKKGKLYVVWEGKDENNENQQIKFSFSSDGGESWSKWKNIRATPKNTQSRPTVLVTKDGTVHVLFYSSYNSLEGTQRILHTYSRNDGETWSDLNIVSKELLDSRHVSSIVLKENTLAAVWRSQTKNKSGTQIYFSLYSSNKWTQPKEVNITSKFSFFPSIGTDSDGNLLILWVESTNSGSFPRDDNKDGDIYVTKLENKSNSFSPKLNVTRSNNAFYPNVLPYSISKNKTFISFIEGKEPFDLKVIELTF